MLKLVLASKQMNFFEKYNNTMQKFIKEGLNNYILQYG
jgi:hypothetical protein